jgi:serine/threonine protein kinase
MSDSSADRDPLDLLAEEFVARYRAGERPCLTEYAQRLPDRAEEVRELFPALVEMELFKPVTADHTGEFVPGAAPSDPERVGEFRILRRVGVGGMGVVYEAVQESLGRHVALKLLPADALADPKRLERFRREAKAAARLHHTNIVPVFGTGEADGRHYYAMQFIAGHPLDAVIDEVRRLKEKSAAAVPRAVSEVAVGLVTGTFAAGAAPGAAKGPPAAAGGAAAAESSPSLSGSLSDGGRSYWATVARVGAQVADALTYAHAQGILHRDVKPANLLLDLKGTVWVTDFGLAKSADADDLTHDGDVVGTLRYLAPERFEGAGDQRADVYALGLTLYELLTLRPAFQAENRAKLVQEVTAAAPPPPRSVNPAIPRDLETVVLKAIQRDPAQRYQSAAELADDLRRYVEDRPIRARRATVAEQAWRWCRRNPAVASLLTAVLLVFAVGGAVAGFFAVRAGSERRLAQEREREANEERNRANDEAAKLRSEKEMTRRLLYISQMNHASVALQEGRLARIREILDETTPRPGEPDLRGWEWHYLDRLLHGEYRTVTLERVSPEARPLPSPSGDGRFGQMNSNPFPLSGNGRRLVGSHKDGEGHRFDVWDTLTGRLVNSLPPTGQPAIVTPPTRMPAGGMDLGPPVAILSLDGGYLGAWEKGKPDDPENSSGRLRIWNVDTGQELTAPDIGSALLLDGSQGVDARPPISLEAGGVRWLEWSSLPTPQNREPPTQEPKKVDEKAEPVRPPEYVARYWDRASGQVTTQRFRPGDGTDTISTGLSGSSGDGRILVFRLSRPDSLKPSPEVRPALPLECWDVAATPPRRVWSAPPPAVPDWTVSAHISPGGKMVAVRDETGVTVYRTEGRAGEPVVEWRSELPVKNNLPPHQERWTVFDDGRLVFNLPYGLAVVSPTRTRLNPNYDDSVSTRQTVLYGRTRQWPVQLADEGKTLVGLGPSEVRVWTLEGESAPRSDLQVIATSPDGRLRVEGRGRSTAPPDPNIAPHPQPVQEDLLVKDAATGQILYRIPVPRGTVDSWAQFAGGSKRLLVQFHNPNGRALPWKLYDTDKGSVVAEGQWPLPSERLARLVVSPGGRWIVQGGRGDSELIVRDALTGDVTCKFHAPEGAAVGAFQFDPAAERLAVTTVPKSLAVAWVRGDRGGRGGGGGGWTAAKPAAPGPFDIHLLNPATGETVWAQKGVDECTDMRGSVPQFYPMFHLLFSTNGRLLVGYFGPKQTFQVWVGRAATGDRERTLAAAPESNTAGFERSRSAGFGSSGPAPRVVTDRDRRRVAVFGGGEVRVWDLDGGALVATVRGHDSPLSEIALNPEGTRLFTLYAAPRAEERGRMRVGVWDLETTRLVFTVQPPDPVLLSRLDRASGITRIGGNWLGFRDGQLSVHQDPLNCTFDGRPVKP